MHIPISRRTALRASGVALSLPLLDVMNPALGFERAEQPKRMVLICNALGLYPSVAVPEDAWKRLRKHGVPRTAQGTPKRLHAVFRPVTSGSEWQGAARYGNDLSDGGDQSRAGQVSGIRFRWIRWPRCTSDTPRGFHRSRWGATLGKVSRTTAMV